MNICYYNVKRIEEHTDLDKVNELLDTGCWKFVGKEFNCFGEPVYVMHKVK